MTSASDEAKRLFPLNSSSRGWREARVGFALPAGFELGLVVARNLFLLLPNCHGWPSLGSA